MKQLQRLMQSFSINGGMVYLNKFGEVIFKGYYKERVWNFNKISYDEIFEYDSDPYAAPKKYTKLEKMEHHKFFRYEGDETLEYKVLEWLSRAAHKEGGEESSKWYLDGINKFLGTNFNNDEIGEVYVYLGNNINRELCIKFVESGYKVEMLSKWRKTQKESEIK